jgi:CMP-2-keto-3-deoxyoctulosonic acid synthetase
MISRQSPTRFGQQILVQKAGKPMIVRILASASASGPADADASSKEIMTTHSSGIV